MSINTLRKYLDDHQVEYVVMTHSKAYTAQRIAARAHVPGNEMAKSVMIKVDGELKITVLRAPDKVSLAKVNKLFKAGKVELAHESEFEEKFPDCEVGAMPPFGNLYDLDVLVDEKLSKDESIVFNACSHLELIRMSYKDYEKLAKPKVADIAVGG